MDERTQDPWRGRLSEYVDGELEPEARAELEAHLARCGPCRGLALELRTLLERARALGPREPGRDLWPAIRREIERESPASPARARRGRASWIAGLAAGVALTLAARFLLDFQRQRGTQVAAGSPYLLLLHEPPELLAGAGPAEIAAVVERYGRWARELGERGKLAAGEKLVDEAGWILRSSGAGVTVEERPERGGIGGFFVVRARDAEEALALTRTCPHLEQGGWIELRPIEATD